MRKILKILNSQKASKQKYDGALAESRSDGQGEIVPFPAAHKELQDSPEQPDHETVSRWLKLADELLGSDKGRDG